MTDPRPDPMTKCSALHGNQGGISYALVFAWDGSILDGVVHVCFYERDSASTWESREFHDCVPHIPMDGRVLERKAARILWNEVADHPREKKFWNPIHNLTSPMDLPA
jgi:hypothetical protein